MYEEITGEDPYQTPMRIYPAPHYTMGGLWVDYNLMSTIPGLLRAGRGQLLRPRRQPPGRQRADAGAGRRLLRHSVHDGQLPRRRRAAKARSTTDHDAFKRGRGEVQTRRSTSCSPIKGKTHGARLPLATWGASCGTRWACRATRTGLKEAISEIRALREEFWQNVQRPRRGGDDFNKNLEMAGRVADFLELGELMATRRAAARGVLRRPLPRGVPDPGGRGPARRRELHATLPPGSTAATGASRRCTRKHLDFEDVEAEPRGATSRDVP